MRSSVPEYVFLSLPYEFHTLPWLRTTVGKEFCVISAIAHTKNLDTPPSSLFFLLEPPLPRVLEHSGGDLYSFPPTGPPCKQRLVFLTHCHIWILRGQEQKCMWRASVYTAEGPTPQCLPAAFDRAHSVFWILSNTLLCDFPKEKMHHSECPSSSLLGSTKLASAALCWEL